MLAIISCLLKKKSLRTSSFVFQPGLKVHLDYMGFLHVFQRVYPGRKSPTPQIIQPALKIYDGCCFLQGKIIWRFFVFICSSVAYYYTSISDIYFFKSKCNLPKFMQEEGSDLEGNICTVIYTYSSV